MRFGYTKEEYTMKGNCLVSLCALCGHEMRHLYKDTSKLHYDSKCHAFIEDNERYAKKIFR